MQHNLAGWRARALGVLVVLGALAGVAAPATAASAIPRSCSSGTTHTFVYNRQPGTASAWFVRGSAGRSHPVGCMAIRVEITYRDTGGDHNVYSGWITSQYKPDGSTLVTTANAPSGSEGLTAARQERQWSNGSHRECRNLETGGGWHPCAG